MSDDLLFAAIFVACVGTLVLGRALGWRAALLCVLFKVSLSVGYFAWFDDGTWRLEDDLTYAAEGADLVSVGLGPAQLFLNPTQVTLVMSATGSRNIGYYVYNAGAQELFGDHYWSPVLLNVLATCLAGLAVSRIAALAGFASLRRRLWVAFFLLHWDVLVWSSLLNLKDTLVMTLTVWLFALGLSIVQRPRLGTLLSLGFVLLVVSFVRWYVTLLFGAAFVGWGLLALRGGRRLFLVALGALSLLPLSTQTLEFSLLNPTGLLRGFVDFLVTPRPWGVGLDYEFLRLPALLHWLTLPLLPVGALLLWRRHRLLQPLVLYCAMVFLFYSALPWLNGPRHRLQLVFILAWMQFAAGAWLVEQVLASRRGREPRWGEGSVTP